MRRRCARKSRALLAFAAMLSVSDCAQDTARAQDTAPAQDSEHTQDMPGTLADDPQQPSATPAPASDGEVAAPEAQANAPETNGEPAPRVGLRLEAQLMAAMSFPFAGEPGGAAFGLGFSYGMGWGTIPILIGLDFMSLGRSNTVTSQATTAGESIAMPTTRTSADRLLDFDLWLRVQPPRWPVRPYAEGFVGEKLVQTRYAIGASGVAALNGSDDAWARAFGWGIGVDFMGVFNPIASFSLTLGLRRLHGTRTALDRTTVVDGAGVVTKQHIATDETILMAGLCGRFDCMLGE